MRKSLRFRLTKATLWILCIALVGFVTYLTRAQLIAHSLDSKPLTKYGKGKSYVLSRWERAYCVLDKIKRPPVHLTGICDELKGKATYTQLDCVESLAFATDNLSLASFDEPKYCVPADFTDVQINMDLLKKYMPLSSVGAAISRNSNQTPRSNPSGVMISVCVKDETRMLLMSVVWHLLLGVDHFFVCDHSSETSAIRQTLQPLVAAGVVTMRKFHGAGHIQQQCYDAALVFAKQKRYKWQGGLDTDEFLVLADRHHSIGLALDSFANVTLEHDRKVGAVVFNWVIQPGYNQISINYPADLYTTPAEKLNFRLRQTSLNVHVKSFALTAATKSWQHVHMPKVYEDVNFVAVNTDGVNVLSVEGMFQTEPVFRKGIIVHHRYRTMQELAAKRERGRATLDCESPESINDTNCAIVHNARRSKNIVSDLAADYLQHIDTQVHSYNCSDPVENIHGIQYQLLANRVKQILTT